MKLLDNHDYLWQWDTGQICQLDDLDMSMQITQVGLSVDGRKEVLRQVQGDTIRIPDQLLQTAGLLMLYLHQGTGKISTTVAVQSIEIRAKPQPDGYVAEDEILSWHQLDSRITALEQVAPAMPVEIYNNPTQLPLKDAMQLICYAGGAAKFTFGFPQPVTVDLLAGECRWLAWVRTDEQSGSLISTAGTRNYIHPLDGSQHVPVQCSGKYCVVIVIG